MPVPEAGDGASEQAVVVQRAHGLRDRERAERLWPVSADRAGPRAHGMRGRLTAPAKRLVRPLVRWYVAPLVDAQRDFNDVTLKLIDDLYEQLELRIDERLLQELEERLLRLERASRAARPRTVVPAGQPRRSFGRFSAAGARLFRLRSAHARLTSRHSRPSAALRRRLRRRRTRARRRLRARRVPLAPP